MDDKEKGNKKQRRQSKADLLRKSIKDCGFNRRQLAKLSGIKYARLYRITREGLDPTLDEAAAIQDAMKRLINGAIDKLNTLPNMNGNGRQGQLATKES